MQHAFLHPDVGGGWMACLPSYQTLFWFTWFTGLQSFHWPSQYDSRRAFLFHFSLAPLFYWYLWWYCQHWYSSFQQVFTTLLLIGRLLFCVSENGSCRKIFGSCKFWFSFWNWWDLWSDAPVFTQICVNWLGLASEEGPIPVLTSYVLMLFVPLDELTVVNRDGSGRILSLIIRILNLGVTNKIIT